MLHVSIQTFLWIYVAFEVAYVSGFWFQFWTSSATLHLLHLSYIGKYSMLMLVKMLSVSAGDCVRIWISANQVQMTTTLIHYILSAFSASPVSLGRQSAGMTVFVYVSRILQKQSERYNIYICMHRKFWILFKASYFNSYIWIVLLELK